MFLIATLLGYLMAPFALSFVSLAPKLRGGLKERLGFVPWLPPPAPGCPRYWLHGASAGDVLALVPTAAALRRLDPESHIVLSVQTQTGKAMAARHQDVFDVVFFAPLDLFDVTRRAFRRVSPTVLCLEYTEWWPQWMAAARRARVPLMLHNGRIAAPRVQSYRWLFFFTHNLCQAFDVMLMRHAGDAARARALGAQPARVFVTGNTKHDALAQRAARTLAIGLRPARPPTQATAWWVAGSTHAPEEEEVLRGYLTLRHTVPHLKLLLAPRYPHRAQALAARARAMGLEAETIRDASGMDQTMAQVGVLETVGTLNDCYARADAVFVGGSFVRRGGQNILEPAAMGKPVVFGPFMHNFEEAVGVLHQAGGVQVQHPDAMVTQVRQWLLNPQAFVRDGLRAATAVSQLPAAAPVHAQHLVRLGQRHCFI